MIRRTADPAGLRGRGPGDGLSITLDEVVETNDHVAAQVSIPAPGTDGPEPTGSRWRWSLGPRQRTAVISWAAFAATFGAARAVTHAIQNSKGQVGDAHVGGVHLHHYLWGIQLLAASGGLAIHGGDRVRKHALVAAGYGAGAALVVDEVALLVHLKDVYRTKKGRLSVLLGLGLIGAVGASFALIPAWRLGRQRHGGDEPPVFDPATPGVDSPDV